MTFNTTSLPLRAAVEDGHVREYLPLRPIESQVRWLLVTPAIEDLLRGRDQRGIFPDVAAETLIGTFLAGHLIRVSRTLTDQKPDLEQIFGVSEVWALCPRRPKPGWRILGRFYERDTFIALRAHPKEELAKDYPGLSNQVVRDWDDLFPERLPLSGNDISDYVSGVFKDVDEDF